MRILFIGGVVGAAGMTAVKSMLPDAISRWEVDLAVVNDENSAGAGFVCEISWLSQPNCAADCERGR